MQEYGDGEDDDRLETLRNIRESCNAATDLLDDLLAYEKMESGISEPHMKVWCVYEVLPDAGGREGGNGLRVDECVSMNVCLYVNL